MVNDSNYHLNVLTLTHYTIVLLRYLRFTAQNINESMNLFRERRIKYFEGNNFRAEQMYCL